MPFVAGLLVGMALGILVGMAIERYLIPAMAHWWFVWRRGRAGT